MYIDDDDFGEGARDLLLGPERKRRGRAALKVLAVVVVLVIGAAGAFVYSKARSVSTSPLSAGVQQPVDVKVPATSTDSKGNVTMPTPDSDSDDIREIRELSDGEENILVIGTDTREGQEDETRGESDGAGLADVLMLVHIPESRSRVEVVSIPRDTMVPFPGCQDSASGKRWSEEDLVQINSTLSMGGPGCVVNTVEHLSGVEITHFAVVDFDAVVSLSEEVGGVPVDLDEPMDDDVLGFHLDAGHHELKGHDALSFLRSRHSVGGGDLARIEQQHKFLSSLLQKVQSSGMIKNPVKVNSLADIALENVELDDSLASIQALAGMAKTILSVPTDKVSFLSLPVEPCPQDNNRLQVVPDDADDMWAEIGGSATRSDSSTTRSAPTSERATSSTAEPSETTTPESYG